MPRHNRLELIAISRDLLNWFLSKTPNLHNSPSYICPLGSNLEFEPTRLNQTRANLNIVYVGSLGKSYDVVGFSKALQSLPPTIDCTITFNIIGSGTQYSNLLELSAHVGFNPNINIVMHGFRDSDYIRDICRVSDIGLVPHVEDGLIPNR